MSSATHKVSIAIKGMSCDGCAKAVKRVVERKDPEAKVSVDLAAGLLTGEARAPAAELAAAITAAGYPASAR